MQSVSLIEKLSKLVAGIGPGLLAAQRLLALWLRKIDCLTWYLACRQLVVEMCW